MRFAFVTALLLSIAGASPTPRSEEDAGGQLPPDVGHDMEFVQFSYGGPGCPQGSIGSTLSSDGSLMNLKYDQLVAFAGEGYSIRDRRKWCQLNIELFVPHGYQFSIMKSDYRGFCYLDEGLTGYHKALYYFTGSSDQISRETKFHGEYDDDYLVTDNIGIESVVWSPCGTNALLNLKQEVGIKPFRGEALGVMDVASSDHKLEQIMYFQWRKCDPNAK